ncbi:MAG: DUF4175 family protein [Planctomycetaceae bacterium]
MAPVSAAVLSRSWLRMSGATAAAHLRGRIEDLRRKRLMIGGTSGLCWGMVAFLGMLLAWVWIDLVLNLPPSLRVTAWLAACATLIVVIVGNYRKAKASSADSVLARQLDSIVRSGGQIQSGLDLASRPLPSGRRPNQPRPQKTTADAELRLAGTAALTSQLADIAVRRAALLADGVLHDAVVPVSPLLKAVAAACGAAFVLFLAVIIGPRMAWTEIKRFFNPYGDHPAWSQYGFDVTPEFASVRYGESLEIEATVAGPSVEQLDLVLVPPSGLRSGSLDDIEPLDVLPMFPESSGAWHASIANITEPFEYFVRVRRARSAAFRVDVITVPEISDVRVEVISPLYTGMAPFRGSVPTQGIEGLPGTEVTFTATSNRPLTGGLLDIISDAGTSTLVRMLPEGALLPNSDPAEILSTGSQSGYAETHSVTGSFVITDNGRVDLTVIDEAGQQSAEAFSVPVRLLQDQSPIVRLLQPRAVSFATPTAMLPVQVAAEDDYGLRRCQLFRSLNDSRHLPMDLPTPEGTPRRFQTSTMLPLAEYGLQPGDEIKLFARVEDNDPNGPDAPIGKGSESGIVTVRIISQEDLERVQQQKAGMEMMMSRYQQAQRRLERLADEMRQVREQLEAAQAADPDSPPTEELRQELQQLAEQMQQEAEAIQQLGDKPLPLELDKQLAPQLQEMAERLRELAEQAAGMSANPNFNPQQAAEQLQQMMDALQREQQRHQDEAMQPLQQLAQVLPLKQNEAEFTQLVLKQRELADRLNSLKNSDEASDPAERARMRELEEEQHRVREQLSDLLDRIEENANSLPDDPKLDKLRQSALEFAQAVRDSQATTEMADAESSLTEFNGGNGHFHSENAAQLLEQFLGQCQAMGGAAGESLPQFNPSLGSSMAQTLNQLVPGMGNGMSGSGMGQAGSGGYSTNMATMNNVGMYGGLPVLDPSSSSSGGSESDMAAGIFSSPFASGQNESGTGFTASQTNPAFGGADWGVPIQYRRQAGRYLQQLAEELEQ